MDSDVALKTRRRGRRQPEKLLEHPVWTGKPILTRLKLLNEKSLCAVATAMQVDEELHSALRHEVLWRKMSQPACKRMAGTPVLLVDFHLRNTEWWNWIAERGPRPFRVPEPRHAALFRNATALVREILIEICFVSLASPAAARLLFGMSPTVIEIAASLSGMQMDKIVGTFGDQMQLRWADNRVFWRGFLEAATGDLDEDAIADVHFQSLQLLGSEV